MTCIKQELTNNDELIEIAVKTGMQFDVVPVCVIDLNQLKEFHRLATEKAVREALVKSFESLLEEMVGVYPEYHKSIVSEKLEDMSGIIPASGEKS